MVTLEKVTSETQNFLQPFFPNSIVNYPGIKTEEILVARDNGNINGVLQFRFNPYNMATAAMSFVCVKPGSSIGIFGSLLNSFSIELIKRDIYSFYSTVTPRLFKSYGMFDKDRQNRIRAKMYPEMLKWVTYVQEIVEPQKVSNAYVVKTLAMGNRTYITPTIVLKHELKNEFRKI